MKTLLHAILLTASAGLISTQLTTQASAQGAPCSDPDCVASAAEDNACRIYVDAGDGDGRYHPSVIGGRIVGYVRAQPEGCYDGTRVYGLQGWRLTMRDDRKIGRIAVIQENGSLEFALKDGDGGEYMDGFVWLVPLPAGTIVRNALARECRGTCRLTLDPKDPDDVVVLIGFDVARVGGDGHVKRLAIGPAVGTRTQPEMQINFSDDDFAYRPRVQYAYIPASAVASRGDIQDRYVPTFPLPAAGSGFPPPPPPRSPNLVVSTDRGDAVLQSFTFAFRNGGHFLEDVGMERRRGAYEAWFQDGQSQRSRRNPDDPFSWRARFVILN